MESLAAYVPIDRRRALARGKDLPGHTSGAVLFADISGFTPLTEALARELGPRLGAEELTKQLNAVYSVLIAEVHRYRGSVIGFSGDAITCWFDGDDGLCATACALSMQQVMEQFAEVQSPSGTTVSLAIKVAVASGPVRRFLVGVPEIQVIDVLAGSTLDHMAEAEKRAGRGEVVLPEDLALQLGDNVDVAEWREVDQTGQRFAVLRGLACHVEADPWPDTLASTNETMEQQVWPWVLQPVYERLKIGSGQFLAEIRSAVPLFLRFTGLNYDTDEAAGQKLDIFIRRVQTILARYEGYLIQLTTGDKGSYLYAVFGAPLAHDDDPTRALAAALELRGAGHEVDGIESVQIGISQGRMWTGAYGSPTRCTYGVQGDEVIVAARLMSYAESDQILISQHIVDAVEKDYQAEFLDEIQLKGKQGRMPVYALSARRAVLRSGSSSIFQSRLVGREDELAHMEQLLAASLAGRGQILRLTGVPGVGKSHLAAEFSDRALARGLRVVVGASQSISQTIPYYPWRQVFRTLLGVEDEPEARTHSDTVTNQRIAHVKAALSTMNPGWSPRLPLLGDLLDLPIRDNGTTASLSPKVRQQWLFALAVEILQTQARAQPLVLLMEDAQWMDEGSLGLTLAVAQAAADIPLLMILAHRPSVQEGEPLLHELDQLPGYHHLDLAELSVPSVVALVSERLKGPPSALALSVIYAQAQGNPFFTEELIENLQEMDNLCLRADGSWDLSEETFNTLSYNNLLVKENDAWVLAPDVSLSSLDLGLPDSVQGTVLSRIDRLPESLRLVLKVASVIGRVFTFDLLARSHPDPPAKETLHGQVEALAQRDLVRLHSPGPQLTYVFKHNITQEVAYATLLERQRRELHQAAGDALEALLPDAVERLAYHYRHSGVQDKAVFYLDKAARKVQHEYANETALNYYDQALALEKRWEWLKEKTAVLHVLGRRKDEQETLRSLEKMPESSRAEVAYLWGQYHEAISDYAQAQAETERSMAACRDDGDRAGEARCQAHLGLIARKQGDYTEAKKQYHQALERLPGENVYLDEQIQILNGLAAVLRQLGEYPEARQYLERVVDASRESGNRFGEAEAFSNLGVIAFCQSHYGEAASYHQQALKIRRDIGDHAGEGISLGNLASAVREMGEYRQALDYFSQALTIQQAIGNRWDEINVWNDIGITYLRVGDLQRAQTCFEKCLALSRQIGDKGGRTYCLGNLGLVARDQGNLEEAKRLLSRGLALSEEQGDRFAVSLFLNHLSIVALMAGKPREAVELASQALSMRQAMDLRLWTTADLTTLAAAHLELGEMAKALDYAYQALTILDECKGQGPEYPERDYFVCYQVLSAAGQTEAARAALQSAYNLVMLTADKITDSDMRQSFLMRVEINRKIVQAYTRCEKRGSD
jgi:predicted ATPase/class 3 adenylate cyclase